MVRTPAASAAAFTVAFGLFAAGVLSAPGCGREAPYAPLQVLDGPGRDGRAVALDQPLRVEFDHALPPALRAAAFTLLDADGMVRVPAGHEVAGRYLLIHPRLPLRADLQDGTLRPGSTMRLVLRGVPHLAAVRSPEGAALVGDQVLAFETLPADDPAALVGGMPSREGLHLVLAGGAVPPQLVVGDDGLIELPLSGPLDPRSLGAPARLLRPGSGALELALELVANEPGGSLLRTRLPSWGPGAVLELPESLEGPGGVRLAPAHRRIRLRGAP